MNNIMGHRLAGLRFGLRSLLLGVGLIALASLAMSCLLQSDGIACGHFPLTIQLASQTNAGIAEVYYMNSSESLKEFVVGSTERFEGEFKAGGFDGKKMVARVWRSSKIDYLGFERGYSEGQHLVLKVEYSDGREIRQALEIPAGRGPRTISVTVP